MSKNLSKKEKRKRRNLLKVGGVAEEVGVLRSTITYYVNIGLLEVDDYTQGKYRLFKKDKILARMTRIKQMKNKGLTIDEIKRIIEDKEKRVR